MELPDGVGTDKPSCPDHNLEMEYDSEKGYWICTNYLCEKKARQRLTINDVSGTVINADLHLYSTGRDADERHFLYIRQQNIFVDLSTRVLKESTGRMHGSQGYHLALLFDNLHNKD